MKNNNAAPDNQRVPYALVILFCGDILANILFVLIGQHDHNVSDPYPILRLVTTAAYFALPLTLLSFFLGMYHLNQQSIKYYLRSTLLGWLIAAPLGVLLRSFANGSGVIQSTFLIVSILAGGFILMVWRFLFAFLNKRRS